ncbi:MAG TPA: hypothetical protein VGP73_29300 [Thermoanaerobaculia bacterium]
MATHALIDNFTGDPDELYTLIAEEINKRELPGYAFSWYEEIEAMGFIVAKGMKARALKISYRGQDDLVLALQTGRIFNVILRRLHDLDPAERRHKGPIFFLYHSVYEEVVSRSVKTALRRHLEARQAPVPKELDLAGIFITSEKAEKTATAA